MCYADFAPNVHISGKFHLLRFNRKPALLISPTNDKEALMVLKVWLAAAFLTVAAYYAIHAWGEIKEAVAIARHGSDDAKP